MGAVERLARPFGTLPELTALHAVERPGHPALVQGERSIDYASLDRQVDRVAAALQRDGVEPRQSVAICAAASLEYVAVFLGALRAGLAVAPIAPGLSHTSRARMIADCGARHLFVDAEAGAALRAADGAHPEHRIILDGSGDAEALDRWLVPGAAKPAQAEVQPDWPFNIIYSSGTTGEPKGIVQPHAMRWVHLQRGPAYGYSGETVMLISTPLYSNTTLVAVFPTLAMGGTVVLMPKFDVRGYLELAERHRVTHTMLVPVQYRRILADPGFDARDLSSFRMKFSTSAPFDAALKSEVLRRWPGGLIELYGMTEGGGTAVLVAHEHRDKLHTVGLPAPGHDIRLIDEGGREVAAGEPGEVVGHSAGMMTGYHNQPATTAQAEWFDAGGKRYIRTGDLGRFDEDGFLMLFDRKKDMIISGGFNVYPSDLEAVIAAHAEVAEVAVVGVPSERWGETPVAFVVPRPGTAPRAEVLRDWANARLERLQRLADVRIVGSLPRSPIGKVLKRELRETYSRARPSSGQSREIP